MILCNTLHKCGHAILFGSEKVAVTWLIDKVYSRQMKLVDTECCQNGEKTPVTQIIGNVTRSYGTYVTSYSPSIATMSLLERLPTLPCGIYCGMIHLAIFI